MKTLKLIALAAFALLCACCKATQPTGPNSGSGPSLVEGVQILDSTQAKFYDIAQANLSNTPGQDMLLLASWLQLQPTVKSVGAYDSTDLDIELKSGLHTIYSMYSLGPDSLALTRGGGNPAQGLKLSPNIQSTNTITNKKILIYTPYVASQNNCQYCLYHQQDMDALQNLLSRAGSDFTVTINYGTSLNDIKTFGDYGLVFIDTHGLPDGFYTSIRVEEGDVMIDSSGHTTPMSESQLLNFIDQDFGAGTAELLKNGSLRLAGWGNEGNPITWQQYLKRSGNPYRIVVGAKYVSQLPAMSNTIIFGNFCYSGWKNAGVTNDLFRFPVTINDPIQPAFTSKQLISYYSYGYTNGNSNPVGTQFAIAMEDSLITKLVLGTDSTGSAYTDKSGQMYKDPYRNDLFQHSGADDYSYAKCGDTLLDARDGQKYATVCIGTQVWMAQNLNYNAPGSISYNNDPANGAIYGRLYDWTTMTKGDSAVGTQIGVPGVCPKGWHVPSGAEWQTLINFLGGTNVAGGMMKATSSLWQSPNTGATNSSSFSAIPGGSSYLSPDPLHPGTVFVNIGTNTFLGSCSGSGVPGSDLIYILANNSASISATDSYDKTSTSSCRCVKDP